MAKKFEFEAPQYVESWRDGDEIDVETFFKENDCQHSSGGGNQDVPRTPRAIHRPHSFSVISRSGKRCRNSSLRDSLYLKEKEFFNKKILNFGKENDAKFTFKARSAAVLKKEPFWPYRESNNFTEGRSPALATEKRSLHRQILIERKKEREKMYEMQNLQAIKEDEEELKKYRKTLEFKANPIKNHNWCRILSWWIGRRWWRRSIVTTSCCIATSSLFTQDHVQISLGVGLR
ncbi:unnamed protein product [Nezara viridula]|uniref:TPX2 C-terminal domain-containing protein n=1 Tax=Nezara viridula TaxID=85310 RepID=A0A9P0HL68_NEZVI|nr:unnamed protein product [Nezara viridula]